MSVEIKGEPVVYVALGDSTGVGVGARKGGGYVARLFGRVERARPGSRLVNLCVSGATTSDVLRTQVGRVGAAGPTLITVGIGINDVTRQVEPERFARNFEEIVARLRAQTGAPVVVSNLPDLSHAPVVPDFMRAGARLLIQEFNARVAESASRHAERALDDRPHLEGPELVALVRRVKAVGAEEFGVRGDDGGALAEGVREVQPVARGRVGEPPVEE